MNYKQFNEISEKYLEIYEIKALNQTGATRENPGPEKRPVGVGAGFHGKVTGIGSKKSSQNDTKADDKRIAKQKLQAKKDRDEANKDKYGISSADRKARARANKEKKAKAGIDDLLKDIRGK